MSIHFRRRRR